MVRAVGMRFRAALRSAGHSPMPGVCNGVRNMRHPWYPGIGCPGDCVSREPGKPMGREGLPGTLSLCLERESAMNRRVKLGDETYSYECGIDLSLTPQAIVDQLAQREAIGYRRTVIYARDDLGKIFASATASGTLDGANAAERVTKGFRETGIETTVPAVRDHRTLKDLDLVLPQGGIAVGDSLGNGQLA